MADPHKLRIGAKIIAHDPHYGDVRGTFGGLIPANPNAKRERERHERIIVRTGPSGFAYVAIFDGTWVKHDR